MKLDTVARDALIRARTALYIDTPFYGILALRLVMQEDRTVKTLCVNHTTIFYNPDFVKEMDARNPNETKAAIGHEIGHIIYDHIDRCGVRNPRKWNAAGDYVINAALKKDGFEIGKSWLYNPAWADMTADHIYTLLPDDDENGDGPGPGGGWGELDAMQPGDPAEAAANAADWKIATIQAANIAKQQGNLPASMERIVDEVMGNKVNWRERLRRFATQHTKNDFSWSRPQRRMIPHGYYLPSLYSEAMGLLVDAIDTSGSIDQYVLNLFGAEVAAAKMMARPEKLINIYCDARVNRVDEFGEHELPTFKMCGGGGTDFRPPFKYIEQHNLKPACFIYLTDGEGRFPDAPPPYPVLWVMTTDIVAPWGETIRIET